MAKQTGLGDHLLVSGYDLSGDIGSVQRVAGGPAALDVTDITQSGYSRLGGLRDGGIDFTSWFDKAASASHPRLSTLPTADVVVTYCRGYVLGNAAASCVAKQIGYDGQRTQDGSLSFTVAAQSNAYGLEWGKQLTAGITSITVDTDGTALDTTASASFGAQAYLQVTSFTGSAIYIGVNHSSDNGVGDPYASLAALETQVTTAPAAYRVATTSTQTVKRYLRLYAAGTFSQCSFLLTVTKNVTATAF